VFVCWIVPTILPSQTDVNKDKKCRLCSRHRRRWSFREGQSVSAAPWTARSRRTGRSSTSPGSDRTSLLGLQRRAMCERNAAVQGDSPKAFRRGSLIAFAAHLRPCGAPDSPLRSGESRVSYPCHAGASRNKRSASGQAGRRGFRRRRPIPAAAPPEARTRDEQKAAEDHPPCWSPHSFHGPLIGECSSRFGESRHVRFPSGFPTLHPLTLRFVRRIGRALGLTGRVTSCDSRANRWIVQRSVDALHRVP